LLSNARSYVTSHELFPSRLGKEAIPRLLSHVDAFNGLLVLAKLLWVLEDKGSVSQPIQLALAPRFLGLAAAAKARLLLTSDPYRTLFFRPQIHLAMKHLLLHGQWNTPHLPVGPPQVQTLGTALFAATDQIAEESMRLRDALQEKDRPTAIALQLALGEYLMKSPNPLHDFVRTDAMYGTIHSQISKSHPPDFIDLDPVFMDATGVPLPTYLQIGLGLLLNLMRYRGSAQLLPEERNFIVFHPHTWFSSSRVSTDHVTAFMHSVSQTPEALLASAQQQSERELAHDFLAMKLFPFIRLGNDAYVPVSYDFVVERLSSATYWTFFDHLRAKGPPKSHLRWSSYHGLLFERYVQSIAHELMAQHSSEYSALITDAAYNVGKLQKKTSDAILVSQSNMVIMEATASRLTAKRTVALGIPEAFFDDCDKVVFQKAAELARFIRDLLDNEVVVDGTSLRPDGRILYPVLVTLEGFPKILPIDNFIYTEIGRSRIFEGLPVQPLSILSIEDLEFVARYPPQCLSGLLEAWQKDVRFPYLTLSQFISETSGLDSAGSSHWFDAAFKAVLDKSARAILGSSFETILTRDQPQPPHDIGA
jgi:hypothetical protein